MSGLRCRCKIIALRPQSARKPHYAIDNPFCRLNRFPLARREPISPKESSTRWSIHRSFTCIATSYWIDDSCIVATVGERVEKGGMKTRAETKERKSLWISPGLFGPPQTTGLFFFFYSLSLFFPMHQSLLEACWISFHVRMRFPPNIILLLFSSPASELSCALKAGSILFSPRFAEPSKLLEEWRTSHLVHLHFPHRWSWPRIWGRDCSFFPFFLPLLLYLFPSFSFP